MSFSLYAHTGTMSTGREVVVGGPRDSSVTLGALRGARQIRMVKDVPQVIFFDVARNIGELDRLTDVRAEAEPFAGHFRRFASIDPDDFFGEDDRIAEDVETIPGLQFHRAREASHRLAPGGAGSKVGWRSGSSGSLDCCPMAATALLLTGYDLGGASVLPFSAVADQPPTIYAAGA